jgi:CheY-like chemotaxis protein
MSNRVLVVEDNPVIRELMLRQLNSFGVNCYAVTRAEEAVELADFFDLILMDVELPGLSGVEAAKLIRRNERKKGSEPIPIVAATGKDCIHECISAGMNAYCAKPLTREVLERVLDDWLFKQPQRLRLLG